jgi:hypothetical protein
MTFKAKPLNFRKPPSFCHISKVGGRGGIRTPGTVTRTPDFESGAFNHSATLPTTCIAVTYDDYTLTCIFVCIPYPLIMQSQPDTQTNARQREEHLSSNGQWRSFPKLPYLLQYVSNGNYYGRIKVSGKVIRESLKTKVWTTAKLRLTDFLNRHQGARLRIDPPKFSDAVALFEADLESDLTIKLRSKEYRRLCLKKIQTSWPGLWKQRLDEITPQSCKQWAVELSNDIASHYYNNTIATLRQVLHAGIKAHKEKGGGLLENPSAELRKR